MSNCPIAREFRLEIEYREGALNSQALRRLPGNVPLHKFVLPKIYRQAGDQAAEALSDAFLIFVRCDKTSEICLSIIYTLEARICHSRYHDALDDFCKAAYDLVGVKWFAIRGSDLFWSVQRTEEGAWLKQCLGGGVR